MDGGKKPQTIIERDPAKESLATVKKLNERIDLLEVMINSRFEQVHDNQEESRLQSLRGIEQALKQSEKEQALVIQADKEVE